MHNVITANGRSSERGNVLFLILIAVALFAALSYAVTQSTRSGAGSSDNETGLINSAQLTQYPAGIRTAVVRMMIGGVDINDVSFNPPSDFTNVNGITNLAVFHPLGGGATYALAPLDVMAQGALGVWHFNVENEIDLVGTTGASGPTTSSVDLIAFLPNISGSVCRRINQELGLPTADGDITLTGITYGVGADASAYADEMQATSDNPSGLPVAPSGGTIAGPTPSGATNPTFSGQPFGCFRDSSKSDIYTYYHVLVER